MDTHDYLFKMLLIGNSGVGKSCLLVRYAVSHLFSFNPIRFLKLAIFCIGKLFQRQLLQHDRCRLQNKNNRNGWIEHQTPNMGYGRTGKI